MRPYYPLLALGVLSSAVKAQCDRRRRQPLGNQPSKLLQCILPLLQPSVTINVKIRLLRKPLIVFVNQSAFVPMNFIKIVATHPSSFPGFPLLSRIRFVKATPQTTSFSAENL